jgi:hypothetical protein
MCKISPEQMQREWLEKNKVTKCNDCHLESNLKTTKANDKLIISKTLPGFNSRRFNKNPSCCIGCGENYKPTIAYPRRNVYHIYCKDCRDKNSPVKELSIEKLLRKQFRELNLTVHTIGISSTNLLEHALDLIDSIFLIERKWSDKRLNLVKEIKIELASRIVDPIVEEVENEPMNTNLNPFGQEFDF